MSGNTGGHVFNFETGTCTKCGISEEFFEDHGEPPCRGGIGRSRLLSVIASFHSGLVAVCEPALAIFTANWRHRSDSGTRRYTISLVLRITPTLPEPFLPAFIVVGGERR
jgi:hypothetical protein